MRYVEYLLKGVGYVWMWVVILSILGSEAVIWYEFGWTALQEHWGPFGILTLYPYVFIAAPGAIVIAVAEHYREKRLEQEAQPQQGAADVRT